MQKLLAKYKNGNYVVELYEDGTKIKYTADDEFNADFPDSIDLKITNRCDLNCPMCHENSTAEGKEGNFTEPFLSTLHRGTELAIGGGNPLSHGGLTKFLTQMRDQGVICNITVNERHLHNSAELVETLIAKKLIYGVGVSLNDYRDDTIKFARNHKNVVLHVINGLFDDFEKIANQDLKILILGYKRFGRGKGYYSQKVETLMRKTKENLPELFQKFACVCFDNLALEQLAVKTQVPGEDWENYYMGGDGESTMYIDLVKNQFAKTSTSESRYAALPRVEDMFKIIKNG